MMLIPIKKIYEIIDDTENFNNRKFLIDFKNESVTLENFDCSIIIYFNQLQKIISVSIKEGLFDQE